MQKAMKPWYAGIHRKNNKEKGVDCQFVEIFIIGPGARTGNLWMEAMQGV